MARKQSLPTGEESNKEPSVSRQRKLRLIKKSEENPSEADARRSGSTMAHANTLESSEPKSCLSLEDLDRRIAIRAHELYQSRGAHHGLDWEDWFEAKRQVMSGEQ